MIWVGKLLATAGAFNSIQETVLVRALKVVVWYMQASSQTNPMHCLGQRNVCKAGQVHVGSILTSAAMM